MQVLAAVAVMAEADNPAQPRSMTLMAGPIDTRINPTKVNELATGKPIEWFEKQPDRHACRRAIPGAGRRVYPGFVQLTAFMSMNLERHCKAHVELYEHLANGEHEKAAGDQGRSTTSISPCSTCRPSSISRPCARCSRRRAAARAS